MKVGIWRTPSATTAFLYGVFPAAPSYDALRMLA